MSDNYLWDRSGEADPDIKQLEDVLGELRYQPRPLEIPASVRTGRRWDFFSPLAIAAAIALITLGLGLWWNLNRRPGLQAIEAKRDSPTSRTPDQSAKIPGGSEASPIPIKPENLPPRNRPHHREYARNPEASSLLVRNLTPKIETKSQSELSAAEQAEKDQILLALRLASLKLNFAQRKAQGVPPLNAIRHQHPIG